MESFVGTMVFLLPGFLAYFWIQAFGVNPVMKYTPIEFTTIAALLWIPVSVLTLLLHNILYFVLCWTNRIYQVWTIPGLVKAANNPEFLLWFLALSVIVSFIIGIAWAMYGMEQIRKLINWVRSKKKLAALSENSSVWDELFHKHESQIVEFGKVDKAEPGIMGELGKVSRTFEPERFSLNHVALVTKILTLKKVPIDKVFVDVKSGTYVKIYNNEAFQKAMNQKETSIFLSEDPDLA